MKIILLCYNIFKLVIFVLKHGCLTPDIGWTELSIIQDTADNNANLCCIKDDRVLELENRLLDEREAHQKEKKTLERQVSSNIQFCLVSSLIQTHALRHLYSNLFKI